MQKKNMEEICGPASTTDADFSQLFRHTSEPLKKILKILETKPQSSKNAQQWTKVGKIL